MLILQRPTIFRLLAIHRCCFVAVQRVSFGRQDGTPSTAEFFSEQCGLQVATKSFEG